MSVINLTFSLVSSGCLQIILVTRNLPITDRNPYFPLLTSDVKKFNNSTLPSYSFRKLGILFNQKGRIFNSNRVITIIDITTWKNNRVYSIAYGLQYGNPITNMLGYILKILIS